MNNAIRYLVERLFDDNELLYNNDELILDELNIADNLYCSPHYIDLGLPSGILWCSHNVGAKYLKDCGDYLTLFDAADKASIDANKLLPFKDDIKELKKYTEVSEISNNDMKGVLLTSKVNGHSIFIPYSGHYWKGNFFNEDIGYLWANPKEYGVSVQFKYARKTPIKCYSYNSYVEMPIRFIIKNKKIDLES